MIPVFYKGALSRRNRNDIYFLKKAEEKGWKVLTSIHTLMELYNIAKDRQLLIKSLINKWVDVSTFLRDRRRMNFNKNDLDEIKEVINIFFIENDFIEFMHIDEEVWDTVKGIVETSNIHSSDALHLASAHIWGCDVLVTHDQSLIKEGNKVLRKAELNDYLRICDINKVEDTLLELKEIQAKNN